MRWSRIVLLIVLIWAGASAFILAVSPTARFAAGRVTTVLADTILPRSFDSSLWQDREAVENDHVRLDLVDRLLRDHDLVGMPADQVLELLGPPDDTSYFPEYQMVYWLGPERSFTGVDSEWLCIQLDPLDRVSEAGVLRD